jgi:hypothetical protein
VAGRFSSNIRLIRGVWIWHGVGLSEGVRLWTHVTRLLVGLVILSTAAIAVGLTAPADGIFSIAVQPVFMRVDPLAIAESRASALGVDIDVKLGAMHMHLGWSAIPLSPGSTDTASDLF